MERKVNSDLVWGLALLGLFVGYTVSLTGVDLQPIGPQGSVVAYGSINRWVHDFFGVNWMLYYITDWAGVAAILIACGFGMLGLCQWIRRKSLRKVDSSILVLGGFYILVFGAYAFFEVNVMNYRPVLIDGVLEPSYPSSTTMLAMCVLPTAMMQFRRLIGNRTVRNMVNCLCGMFTLFMVVGRLLSGVHWFTDILGGMIFSGAMVLLYRWAEKYFQ